MLDTVLTPQHYVYFVPIQTVGRDSAAKNNSARSLFPPATCTTYKRRIRQFWLFIARQYLY